jgi:hypothetical protein
MTHEELVEASEIKVFELARPMILQGLSYRLVNFENTEKKGKLINLVPRAKFPPIMD